MPTPIATKKVVKGFTLLEMSIVLIIAGLILGMTLPLLRTFLERQRDLETQKHQEQVLFSMASYVLKNNHLPEPADSESGGEATRRTCEDHICRGHIPFRTLGIPEALAKDGNHRWMLYAVPQPLTGTTVLESSIVPFGPEARFCRVRGEITLEVLDEQNHPFNLENDLWAIALKSGEETLSPVFSLQQKKGERLAVVTRNNLMALYAHYPCPPGSQESGIPSE